jgi:hypothetical protein
MLLRLRFIAGALSDPSQQTKQTLELCWEWLPGNPEVKPDPAHAGL